jgi:hypothetical protein
MNDNEKATGSTVRFEADRLLSWLREVLDGSDGVDIQIVVEQAADARSSVQITLHDVPGALAGLEVRRPA